jgi:hypothetical protein
MVLTVLSGLVGLGSLVCWILVLVKMFPKEGPLKGILAIICGLYAFVWGWMNFRELGLKTVMMVWTVLFVLGIILNLSTLGRYT